MISRLTPSTKSSCCQTLKHLSNNLQEGLKLVLKDVVLGKIVVISVCYIVQIVLTFPKLAALTGCIPFLRQKSV